MALTPKQEEWLFSSDTGTSSLTIFETITGHTLESPRRFGWTPPADSDDFGRCRRLFERFPEWRSKLGEVADRHPAWRPVVEAWDRLERLHVAGEARQLYAELSALTDRR